jgi:alanyl-tRNA synthetase
MSDRFDLVEFPEKNLEKNPTSTDDRFTDALIDNMGNIIALAEDILEIKKMRVQSEALLEKMKEDRARLRDEAEAYVKTKNADTKQIIDKMQMARELLNDFYKQKNTSGVTAEEFSTIIKSIYGLPD